MNKLTILCAALLTALCVTAAPSKKIERRADGKMVVKAEKAVKQLSASKLLKLSAATDSPIIDRPEGSHHYCFQEGNGFTLLDDYLYAFPVSTAGEVVWADNNVVYLRNAISSYNEGGWVKGTRSADGKHITMQFPQHVQDLIGTDASGKEHKVPLYISVMKYNKALNDYELIDANDNIVTYTIADDGKIVMDGAKEFKYDYDPVTEESTLIMPDTMLTCYYEYDPYGDGVMHQYWYGYSDLSQELTPLPDDLIVNEIPDGLTYELWGMTDATGAARSIDVAIVGNEIFIKNLDESVADCVVKGTIEGDKVTFLSRQFYGINQWNDAFIFFIGCGYGMTWFEDFQDYYEGFIIADKLVMDYDATARTLTAPENTGFLMNAQLDELRYYTASLEPVFTGQDQASLNAAPKDPEFAMYEYIADYGQAFISWTFPNNNVNGSFIDINRMYYNVFVDGDLYTFTADKYLYVSEDITDLPYNYSDDNRYDIFCDGTEHVFYIFCTSMKSFGVVMYYLAPDGNLYHSNRVTYNAETGQVETDDPTPVSAASASEPVRIEFTNLNGIRVSRPVPGTIYLRTVTLADGSTRSSKLIAR